MKIILSRGHFSRLSIACLLSVFLHSAGVVFFVESSEISTALFKQPLFVQPEKKVTLEFIPSSPTMLEKKCDLPTPVISEKNTASQNPISKPTLPQGLPYQHGTTEYRSLPRSTASRVFPHPLQKPKKEETAPVTKPKEESDLPKHITKKLKKSSLKEKQKEKKTSQKSTSHNVQMSSRGHDEDFSPAQKNIETVSDILAEWAYNSRSHVVAQYISKEFKKISHVWNLEIFSSPEFSNTTFYKIKKTVVVFKIMPDGKIESLQVIEHEGPELSLRYPIVAIEKCAPFSALPPEVLSYIRTNGLWVRLEFNYTKGTK
ncbi:MAG: hypothetical protein HYS08_02155 [Chlamydiae bacterium]|nr:hypothetical protein [Chlamydiota bacterium]MBI3266678.1 hypothetical protein [Chlamydiota bacterium]